MRLTRKAREQYRHSQAQVIQQVVAVDLEAQQIAADREREVARIRAAKRRDQRD